VKVTDAARSVPVDIVARVADLRAQVERALKQYHELDAPEISDAEYDALFQGIGKPEVFLYGSYHLAGAVNDKPLVELRRDLQALGLERAEGILETEDHLASLCEVMRFLIAGDDVAICNLEQQRRFFRVHLQPWVEALAGEIEAHPRADFYRVAAGFLRAFAQVEAQGFDLIE